MEDNKNSHVSAAEKEENNVNGDRENINDIEEHTYTNKKDDRTTPKTRKAGRRLSDPKYLVPFEQGFVRQLVTRTCNGQQQQQKKRTDVYYKSPEGVRLRSPQDVEKKIRIENYHGLSKENFVFCAQPIPNVNDPKKQVVREALYSRSPRILAPQKLQQPMAHEEQNVLNIPVPCSQTEKSENVNENSLTKEVLKLRELYKQIKGLYDASLQQIEEDKKQIENLKQELEDEKKTVSRLKADILEHENLRQELGNTTQANIRVFCRVRPVNSGELDKQLCSFLFPSEMSLEIKGKEQTFTFTFDKVFQPAASQADLFKQLALLVESALYGYNVCIFAYGPTGSGKTYTMQGSSENQGIIPRTIDFIFEKIQKLTSAGWTYKITASFLEIYNENIRDLASANTSYNCVLRYNEGRGVTVTNLELFCVNSASELQNLMKNANRNRAVATTDFNEHSSRSHAVTKINLEGYNDLTKVTYRGSINLVDLAGSESAKSTASDKRVAETKYINKSLLVLDRVMRALHNKDVHVPYRESKLTQLLESCLSGNSKTLMLLNIAPLDECFSESLNSLRFGSKVKNVKTTVKKNKT